jgi:hypothetical protein
MRLLIACVVLGLACGGAPRGGPTSSGTGWQLLAHVPADTPYLFGALEPIDPVVRDFMLRGIEPKVKEAIEAMKLLGRDRAQLPAWMRAALVVVDELQGKPANEWWAALGFDPRGRFIVYGLGLWPVMRIEVGDPVRLRGVFERALAAGHLEASVRTAGGRTYWSFELGTVTVVAAIVDGQGGQPAQLVTALLPRASLAAALPHVLGTERPQTPMSASTIAELTRRHRLLSFMIWDVESRRVVDLLTRPTTQLDREITNRIGPIDAACRADLDRVAAAFPRLVFGYRAVNTVSFDATVALEASPAITSGLASLHTTSPGVVHVHAHDALFAFGAAIDSDRLASWISSVARGLRDKPLGCSWFTWVNEGASWLDSTLSDKSVLSLWRGWRGFAVTVDDIDVDARTAKGDVLVVGAHAADVVNKLTALIPALAALQIRADGAPVALPVEQLGVPWVRGAHVALEPDRLALAFGGNSRDRVRSRLALRAPAKSPLLMFYSDGARFNEVLAQLGRPQENTQLGTFTMAVDVTDKAITMDMRGSWR